MSSAVYVGLPYVASAGPEGADPMNGKLPLTEEPYFPGDAAPAPWAEACRRLEESSTYWLATVRVDGLPHLVPILAVWVENTLHFAAAKSSRKARNLARNSHCVVTTSSGGLDLVVEGRARTVRDEQRLLRIAEAYASKYGWKVDARDGALHAEGAPTAGPPPYEMYEVTPTTVLGLPTDERFRPTRWRF